ncbi:class I adenylate-forming enzyme family protein [Nonomuraea longicatena]|uniref:Class I adenylate-forming enzyme family protein n=1 Tax=Nonomuraea longicatena TaxID=83682 RepID=A0ABN1PJL9_9ACTN
MNLTLSRLLAARAHTEPGQTALVVHGRSTLTFGDWTRRADTVAAGLLARGLRPGDRVGLRFSAAEWGDYAVAFMGVLRAGAVAVPLSDRSTPADLDGLLRDCRAAGLLHGAGPLPGAGPYEGGWPLAETTATPTDLPDVRPGAPAQILYTPGAEGVLATHAGLAHGLGGGRRPFPHSRHLAHAFPIGTGAGQSMLTAAVDARPAVVTLPRFTPGRFAALIETYRAGTVFVVPSMAVELLDAGVHDRHDLSSVLLLGSVAAPLPGPIARRLTRAFPSAAITNYYASAQAAAVQTIMLFDPERPGSVGRAVAGGGVRVTAPDGTPAAPGETGEVWTRTPACDRWVRMGDLGHLDEEGYLFLVDRDGDVVESGAFKVSTLRVEAVVHTHPAVAEAAVVGVPHPVLGRVLAAVVVTREPLSAADLRLFLKDRLAPHELPAHVRTVEALPRGRGGKVDKRQLMGAFR